MSFVGCAGRAPLNLKVMREYRSRRTPLDVRALSGRVDILRLSGVANRDPAGARADRRFRCRIRRGPGPTGHIHIPVGTRELVLYFESGPTADFVVTRRGIKWANGEPAHVTDEDFEFLRTTLKAWAQARGSSEVVFKA